MMNNFDCDIILDLLPLYLDNMTSEETNAVIQEHLESCESCREEYERMSSSFTEVFRREEQPKGYGLFRRKRHKSYYKRKTIVKQLVYGYAFLMLGIIIYCILSITFS